MDLNWLQSILLGLISGLTDILPVSAQAHRQVMLKLFGLSGEPALLRLIVDLGVLVALWYGCRGQIIRLTRAQRLVKVPKRRRKRPLDTKSLMDYSLLKTTLIPVILAFLLYGKTRNLSGNLILVSLFLFINGIILYLPQFLPGSNKDSSYVSRIEGLLLGLGGAVSTVPGFSCVGLASSIGSVLGMEKGYTLNMALLMHIPVSIGFVVWDMVAVVETGLGGTSFGGFMGFLLSGVAAFAGVILGIHFLRKIVATMGNSIFAFYCWGAALFTFILSLSI